MSLFGNVSAINSRGKCTVMNLSSKQINSSDCFNIASGQMDVLSFGQSDAMGQRLQFQGVRSFITRRKKNVSPLKVPLYNIELIIVHCIKLMTKDVSNYPC